MPPEQAARTLTDVSVAWPPLEKVARTLLFRAEYNTTAVVAAATLLGLAAGAVGCFALLRKRSMMADALAHCALPGIGAAFLVATWLGGQGRGLPVLLLGACVSGIVGVLCVQALVHHTRIREDAAIGSVLSVFFGLGVVLLSYIQTLSTGNQGGLAHFIYGQTAAMRAGDAWLMGAVAALSVAALALLFKQFRAVCFDDRFAAAIGIRVGWIDLFLMALVTAVTVVGLQAVGLVLIVAMLIIPPAAARFWTERLTTMVIASGLIGALSGYLGSAASALLPRLPAGAVIVLTAGTLFLLSFLFAPRRGVLAELVRRLSTRFRIAEEHLLRAAFESLESAGIPLRAGTSLSPAALMAARRWNSLEFRLLLLRSRLRGLVRPGPSGPVLTALGASESTRVTKAHRLWEVFLVEHSHLPPSHVHQSADAVEHALSEEIVRGLERAVAADGGQPPTRETPPSVHGLDGLGDRDEGRGTP